ncbi:MAG: IS1634 family transposase, partial [Streptococcaceae bacterium]|nr:IS1634 family transposase [Streptococcaceae bacterium]
MAYITVRKNREGKSYVYLVEGYRQGDKVRSRILKSYGQLEKLEIAEPGALERLKKEAKAGTLPELQALPPQLQVTYDLDTNL